MPSYWMRQARATLDESTAQLRRMEEVSRLSGGKVEIGLVPFGAIGLTLFGIDLFFATPAAPAAYDGSAAGFLQQAAPAERFQGRSGPLRLLVVGGSLGAQALNRIVPQALALLPEQERPQVLHQSGEKQIDALRAAYAQAGVQADLTPFIDDTASAYAEADLVIARAGASTVTELAAVGAAAVFVPFPAAVDDHQTTNARFLVDAGAAWLEPQAGLTPQKLAHLLRGVNRRQLQDMAERARAQCKPGAVDAVVAACAELAKVPSA